MRERWIRRVAMRCARPLAGFLLSLLLGFAIAPSARALVISYELEDLPDEGGLDLWEYRYFLSGEGFASGQGFSILFPLGDTLNLSPVATSAGVDWDIIALQPDPLLGADGLFDALARVDGATLAEPFAVHFAWVAPAQPGSQIFELYDVNFDVIDSGETVPVPEPGTGGLLGVGLGWLVAWASSGAAPTKR